MIMTDIHDQIVNESTDNLLERKRALENSLATAEMHGVEAPPDLVAELKDTQKELAKRLANETK